MTIQELKLIVDELHARMINIYDASNDEPCWFDIPQEELDELWILNDEFNSYQSRLLYLIGKQIERCPRPELLKDKRKADNGTYFITISPPPEANLQEFIKATHQFMALKVIKEGTYVFEQRGVTEAEMGRGFHTHILCDRNVKPSEFKKALHRVFDKFFREESPGEKQLKVENVENTEKTKVLRYMTGDKREKKGKNKAEKISVDKIWRKSLNIAEVFKIDQIE